LSPPNAKFADLETWNAASDNAKINDQPVAAIRVTSRVLDRCYRTVTESEDEADLSFCLFDQFLADTIPRLRFRNAIAEASFLLD
jgi:hypothetical protein